MAIVSQFFLEGSMQLRSHPARPTGQATGKDLAAQQGQFGVAELLGVAQIPVR